VRCSPLWVASVKRIAAARVSWCGFRVCSDPGGGAGDGLAGAGGRRTHHLHALGTSGCRGQIRASVAGSASGAVADRLLDDRRLARTSTESVRVTGRAAVLRRYGEADGKGQGSWWPGPGRLTSGGGIRTRQGDARRAQVWSPATSAHKPCCCAIGSCAGSRGDLRIAYPTGRNGKICHACQEEHDDRLIDPTRHTGRRAEDAGTTNPRHLMRLNGCCKHSMARQARSRPRDVDPAEPRISPGVTPADMSPVGRDAVRAFYEDTIVKGGPAFLAGHGPHRRPMTKPS